MLKYKKKLIEEVERETGVRMWRENIMRMWSYINGMRK